MATARTPSSRSGASDSVIKVLRPVLFRFHGRLALGRGARTAAVIAIVLYGGAQVFSRTQHVSFFTALYWAVTTVTTVGYGDVTPHTTAARVVAMVMMVVGVPVLGPLLWPTRRQVSWRAG